MNLGLSDNINSNFDLAKIVPVPLPLIMLDYIIEPSWVAGFVTGEGCFDVKIRRSNSHKIRGIKYN